MNNKLESIWIARDACKELYLYTSKPERGKISGVYCVDSEVGDHMTMDKSLHPEITFESGPVEFELKRKDIDNG